jgi:membrane fusion protein, adhesin transport system
MIPDQNNPHEPFRYTQFQAWQTIKSQKFGKTLSKLILTLLALSIAFMFLPWTQNIRSAGMVTTLRPEQRPQTINSVIAGKIEKWYVKEGDFVNKGDTILFLSEIKDAFFDPQMLARTREQIDAKSKAVESIGSKIGALENQLSALNQTKKLKLEQATNYLRQVELKVESDSMDLIAAITELKIADTQYKRIEELYQLGLNSLVDVEQRQLRLQNAQANKITAENKWLTSRNEWLNAQVELISIEQQFQDKLAKVSADKAATLSDAFDGNMDVSKMEGQYSNFKVRMGMYHVTAPQDGYITKTIRAGIGETVFEGEQLLSIMPAAYDLAVELYISPVDMPLIHTGNIVNIIFDGWPSVVFSGWPNLSFGTFIGRVSAIDNFISENGKYRILVSPDPEERPWPVALRIGSGAIGMALLKDVPVGYEIWRKINGFPPDYYVANKKTQPENNFGKPQKGKK